MGEAGNPLQCQIAPLWSPLSHKFSKMRVIQQRKKKKKLRITSGDSLHDQCVSVWCFDQYVLNRHKKLFQLLKMKELWDAQTPGPWGVTRLWNWPYHGIWVPPDPLRASWCSLLTLQWHLLSNASHVCHQNVLAGASSLGFDIIPKRDFFNYY